MNEHGFYYEKQEKTDLKRFSQMRNIFQFLGMAPVKPKSSRHSAYVLVDESTEEMLKKRNIKILKLLVTTASKKY